MSEEGDAALVGRTIAGKFRVEQFLGGGAMGAVYRAKQTALDKDVAVKVMHRTLAADKSFVGRFHREAKAASLLDHPNSLRVIDFGEEPDGLLYIAMEYVAGRDLYQVIHEDWPLSDGRIGDILCQVLAAIAAAHESGVIHRDLKPENIMVLRTKNDEGHQADAIKVLDFGIAKITDHDTESRATKGQKLTTQGLVVGTPEYMSPEQARGEKLDARSDLYSLGVILYQLLTGRTPFTGDQPLAIVLKHISDVPVPPREIYPGVNPGLEAIALRAIEKTREARFQSAREMRSAIRAVLEGRPIPVDAGAPTASLSSGPYLPTPSSPLSVAGPPRPGPGTGTQAVPTGPLQVPTGAQPGVPAPAVANALSANLAPVVTTTAPESSGGRRIGPLVMGLAVLAAAALGSAVFLSQRGSTHVTPAAPAPDQPLAPTKSFEPVTPPVAPSPVAPLDPDPSTPAPPVRTEPHPTRKILPPVKTAPSTSTAPAPSTSVAPTKTDPAKTDPAKTDPAKTDPAVAPSTQPASPDVVSPALSTQPTTTPAPTATAPPFSAAACTARAGHVHSNGAVSSRDLRHGDLSSAYTPCAKLFTAPPQGPARVTMRFDNRAPRGVTCTGNCPPAVAACVQQNTHVRFNPSQDITGEVAFHVDVTFRCP